VRNPSMVDATNELDVPTDSVRATSMRWNIMVQLIVVFGVTLWLGPVRREPIGYRTDVAICDGATWPTGLASMPSCASLSFITWRPCRSASR
jgi:hypothetical protein